MTLPKENISPPSEWSDEMRIGYLLALQNVVDETGRGKRKLMPVIEALRRFALPVVQGDVNQPLDALELDSRIRIALQRSGCYTIKELCDKSAREIEGTRNIGGYRLPAILAALREFGCRHPEDI